MNLPTDHICAVCGEKQRVEGWFLLAESHWQDRLRILGWNNELAAKPGVYCACSPLHVEQLVIHWMTAGCLDHPFAVPPREKRRGAARAAAFAMHSEVDTSAARLIGELAVDRESMLRVLSDSPQSLSAILEALVHALRKETCDHSAALDCEELTLCSPHRQI